MSDAFKDNLEVVGGVQAEECSALYIKDFEPVAPEKIQELCAPNIDAHRRYHTAMTAK